MKLILSVLLIISSISFAYAENEKTEKQIMVEQITKLLTDHLWNDYDVTSVEITKITNHRFDEIKKELINSTGSIELKKVTASFSATRNSNTSITKSSDGAVTTLNQDFYKDPNKCKNSVPHLYLHCGVSKGHIFAGEIELFMAKTNKGLAILCSSCNRLSSYRLDGYLILGNRKKEGYVWFP